MRKRPYTKKRYALQQKPPPALQYPIRLNRLMAHAGICSRRKADELIVEGKIKVNGETITAVGTQVSRDDKVEYRGQPVTPQNFIYLLLNKPKDYITTMDDPQERKTVMQLIKNACAERVYPVGRLDRNTTGLMLFTNDGAMSQKLMHPSHKIKKIYQVTLHRPITAHHLQQIEEGVMLEDGKALVDEVALLSKDKKELGIQIHIGKNRIVRRIFEHLGYEVVKLDRTMYGTLTKKELPRGKWRMLTPREVVLLKSLS